MGKICELNYAKGIQGAFGGVPSNNNNNNTRIRL